MMRDKRFPPARSHTPHCTPCAASLASGARSSAGISRRDALALLALLGCGVALPRCKSEPRAAGSDALQPRGQPPPAQLIGGKRDTLAAAVERVFPGALAAGALEFFERLFAERAFLGVRQQFQAAASVLDRAARLRAGRPFAAIPGADQDAILQSCKRGELSVRGFDGTSFFKRLVVLTLESYLGDPRHGGNRDEVGWKVIGYQPCHFTPRRIELISSDAPRRGLPY